MPFTLTMPKLSPTMEEGTITKWHKKVGDQVKAGDVLFEVATDKATVEHSALDDGFLRQILINEGKEARVGDPIAIMTEKADESIEGYVAEGVNKIAPVQETAAQSPTEETVSAPKQNMKTGAGLNMPAFVPEAPLDNYTFDQAGSSFGDRLLASPLAKKMAQDKELDLTTVKGSGPGGRIMSRDLEKAPPSGKVAFGSRRRPADVPGSFEEIPLTPMRKVVGQRLQESKTFIPHFYVSQSILADKLEDLRNQLMAGGLKVSFNDLIVRAVALSLREHPVINSGFNTVNSTIIRFKTIDISIAVSLEDGLITPIVRHADYKNVGQISAEIKDLVQRARKGKLKREEYAGGSFTISNLGMFGVSDFIAVINPPQGAILAVSGMEEKPMVKNGQIVIGKSIMFTLSADHRVIDGADCAKFLKTLQHYLENPALLVV